MVGRLSPWKGQDVFIAAAEIVLRQFPDTEFILAGAALFGEEEYDRSLRRRVELLGLSNQVRFLGHRDDVWSIYAELDVAVHASTLPEPWGNVVLEAMASGAAIVAAAAGGPAELISDGETGLLVPPGDPVLLAEAIAFLLAHPEKRASIAAAGQRGVLEHFSPREDADAIQALYTTLAWR